MIHVCTWLSVELTLITKFVKQFRKVLSKYLSFILTFDSSQKHFFPNNEIIKIAFLVIFKCNITGECPKLSGILVSEQGKKIGNLRTNLVEFGVQKGHFCLYHSVTFRHSTDNY